MSHVVESVAVANNDVQHVELTASEAKAIKREEKEDYLRDHECDCCRFIPFGKPSKEDHGVGCLCRPAICPHSRKNYMFNSVFFHESLGEIGYHFLDYHRNFFFGFATLLSVAGVALLIIGAAALVPSSVVIKNTYWSSTSYYNKTLGIDMSISVGLESLVYSQCVKKANRRLSDYDLASDFETSSSSYLRRQLSNPPPKCDDVLLKFSDNDACKSTGIFESVCKTCGDAATSLNFGVAFSALGKFVALFSMQKRMYGYADSPSLKFIGMCTELVGFISLLSTVSKFGSACTASMADLFKSNNYPGYTFKVRPGVGMNCFIAGAVASFVRFLLHLLTPLPHRGKGVVVPIMKTITRLFTCKGCCQLYDGDTEEKERAAKHAALHADDPITPVGEQLKVTHA